MELPVFAVRSLSVSLALALAGIVGAQEIQYGLASWPEKGRGNHRAVVRVTQKADAVWAHIQWRRRDRQPETKDIRVFDAATGKRVTNVVRVAVTRESGDLVFQPTTAPGDYEVYYLPYDPPGTGPFGDAGNYFPPEDTAGAAWRAKHGLTKQGLASGKWRELPRAELVEIQARGEFHRMDPMEVIATPDEVAALLAKHADRPYLLFPEDRTHAIRMFEDLPYRWIERGVSNAFVGEAQPNEFYPFQIGVFAARRAIHDVRLRFSDLQSETGRVIPAAALRCFNLGGTDWLGRRMTREFPVGKGKVRPLWIGVDVPADASGVYRGEVVVKPIGEEPTTVRVELTVKGPALDDRGDSELWRLSRLRWLDSTLGLDDEVIPPFTPIELRGDTARIIGRQIRFSNCGLPRSVRAGREVLARPVEFVAATSTGAVRWSAAGTQVLKQAPGTVERETTAHGDGLSLTVRSKLECDGCLTYRATLRTTRALDLKDVRLDVPLRREVAKYMMGMSRRGGLRPREWKWKWDVEQAENLVWLGDYDAGLQLKLCGPRDVWQLRNQKDTGVPASWSNGGKGGCSITEDGDTVLVRAYTGDRRLTAGEELEFRFRFLITPLKPLDSNHWNWRYGDVRGEANILHVHHGSAPNPNINYPFHAVEQLRETVSGVKALRHKEVDHGSLTYPAKGNVRLDSGAVHLWVRINFDPQAGQARQARYNQQLFSLNFPNEDQLGFYWNIDDRGMRAYVRKGAPTQNQYPILFGVHSPDWRKGQRHVLSLSWNDALAVFVDGKQLAASQLPGRLSTLLPPTIPSAGTANPIVGQLWDSPARAPGPRLRLSGSGFVLDAIKVTEAPYAGGQALAPTADDQTLLLDTFAAWDGGPATRPERAAGGSGGVLEGVCESAPGQHGKEIVFSSRKIEVPPKGVNLYYTVRELSNYVAERWALRSLGDEVFVTDGVDVYTDPDAANKPAKGYPWLREHLVTGYKPAWRTKLGEGHVDAAIATQGLSRWHNYYVEGMRWLMENTGVDGLYLDGIGYDREIMKRIAKVMHRADPNSRINFHSGDGWCPPWDRDRRMSAANTYLEHFPYISNLWFGELFDYNADPDFWLVEISGIPFGLTGEMLNYQTGGNPYRGMIYGMTSRQHPSCTSMWRLWDEFGIQDAEMLGYWDPRCPVRTDHDGVLATVYRKPGKSLIALAHWPSERTRPKAYTRAMPKPPTLDGKLTPGEWDQAAKLTGFTVFDSDEQAPDPTQTEVCVTHDEQKLYIAFRCLQPGRTVKADATQRDGMTWEDDALELFLQPELDSDTYYQFVVELCEFNGNSKGVFADNRNQNMEWDGDWAYRTSVSDGHWDGELTVSFASLGMPPPKQNTVLGLNLCRDQQLPRKQLSCWAPVRGSFHDVSGFGRLVLASSQPATREELGGANTPSLDVRLQIDWKALGLNPAKSTLKAPPINHFQPTAQFAPSADIPIEPGKGWLLVLQRGPGR